MENFEENKTENILVVLAPEQCWSGTSELLSNHKNELKVIWFDNFIFGGHNSWVQRGHWGPLQRVNFAYISTAITHSILITLPEVQNHPKYKFALITEQSAW